MNTEREKEKRRKFVRSINNEKQLLSKPRSAVLQSTSCPDVQFSIKESCVFDVKLIKDRVDVSGATSSSTILLHTPSAEAQAPATSAV